MSIALLQGNALTLPLASASVDLIVTSPPYFALRSYRDKGKHYEGQIGSEDSPHAFVDALLAATREMIRVLKPTGSIWVNLGDKYCSPGGHTDNNASSRLEGRRNIRKQGRADRSTTGHGVPAKSLFGIPWRYAIRCIDELGLTLRAEVIWSKTNGMPESVDDRVRRAHEQWFHFSLGPDYYSSIDEVRETPSGYRRKQAVRSTPQGQRKRAMADSSNPLGRLPGSVWEIASQPLRIPDEVMHARCCNGQPQPDCEEGVDHFAAFPMEFPRRIIQGWAPSGICVACGEGRRPLIEREFIPQQDVSTERNLDHGRLDPSSSWGSAPRGETTRRIIGEQCDCPNTDAPTRPAVILDPFGGTGTVALIADVEGANGISVEMSGDYTCLAQWRTSDPVQRALAMQVERPPAKPAEMDSLLDMVQEGAA